MWTEDKPTFEGKYYTIDGPINEPKSHKAGYKIPLWIGGGGPKVTLKLVAQYGDACNVGGGDPATAKEKLEILAQHCEKLGRDMGEIRKSTSLNVFPIAKGADPVKATELARKHYMDISFEKFAQSTVVAEPEAIVERVNALQEAGIDYLINYIPGVAYDLEPLQRYAEEVIPAFAK